MKKIIGSLMAALITIHPVLAQQPVTTSTAAPTAGDPGGLHRAASLRG